MAAHDPEPASVEHRLEFRATPRLVRLGLAAGVSLATALATGRPEVLALATAPLVLLAVASRDRLPRTAAVRWWLAPDRCVEGDQVELRLRMDTARGAGRVLAEPVHEPSVAMGGVRRRGPAGRLDAVWPARPTAWGRTPLGPGTLTVHGPLGLYAARLPLGHRELVVYPGSAALSAVAAPPELPARFGEHPTRAVGSGVEFRGVRPYLPGDRRRDIDWRTSARHRQLFVRQYAAERAMDLVLLLDVGSGAGGAQHVGPPGRSALDLAVRGATGLAVGYLRQQDRVGVVALGGTLRWLPPDRGARQLYRIADAVMEVRIDESQVRPGLERVPPAALPRAAVVVVFSPLLDERALAAVRDLRGRGATVVLVDVLTVEPGPPRSDAARLALRVWRLARQVTRYELAGLGVPVLTWDGSGDLGVAVEHALRPMRPAVRT